MQTSPTSAAPTLAQATYVLPLKLSQAADGELTSYLRRLGSMIEVIVVDGSAPDVFAAHATLWDGAVRHLPVRSNTLNGKVAGVCDGVLAARTAYVVIADDDVRYDASMLRNVVERLADHDAVVPQNYFDPLPWHARWDTGRSLVNRAFALDYAGTLGVRREAFLVAGGYCGAVLFENLELLRTLRARGFDVHHAQDVFVARRPPEAAQFTRQRVRQAYDSLAQPGRLAMELSVLPVLSAAWLSGRRRGRATSALGVAAVQVSVGAFALAEVGRRRSGGTRVFERSAALWAPLWTVERAVCSWLALASLARGGARYAGHRLGLAAHRSSALEAAARTRPMSCPAADCSCRLVLRDVAPRRPHE
ncbi:MAG: glycosyltransferase [Nocardioidaceae bacterium]